MSDNPSKNNEKTPGWKYGGGRWTRLDNVLTWPENEEQWERVLERAGYSSAPIFTCGEDLSAAWVDVFRKQDGSGFLLEFVLRDGFPQYVIIDDVPDLMAWLRDYSGVFVLNTIDAKFDSLYEMLRKTFRLWHGHDAGAICWECNPDLMRRFQECKQKAQQ